VAQVERRKDHRKDHPEWKGASGRNAMNLFQRKRLLLALVDRSLRKGMALRLKVQRAEGLFVLARFCPRTFHRALACCGLRKIASWLRMVTCSGLSLEARPKTSWKSTR